MIVHILADKVYPDGSYMWIDDKYVLHLQRTHLGNYIDTVTHLTGDQAERVIKQDCYRDYRHGKDGHK